MLTFMSRMFCSCRHGRNTVNCSRLCVFYDQSEHKLNISAFRNLAEVLRLSAKIWRTTPARTNQHAGNFCQAGPRPALSSAFQLQPGVDRLSIEPTGRLAAAQDALSAVRFERTENRAEPRCPEHKRSAQHVHRAARAGAAAFELHLVELVLNTPYAVFRKVVSLHYFVMPLCSYSARVGTGALSA